MKFPALTPSTAAVPFAFATSTGGSIAATKRIKDLEIAWGGAEAALKPRAASDWQVVDKTIDRALTELRAGKPDTKVGAQSLKDLLAVIDAVN